VKYIVKTLISIAMLVKAANAMRSLIENGIE
jgi:hypothetical protein